MDQRPVGLTQKIIGKVSETLLLLKTGALATTCRRPFHTVLRKFTNQFLVSGIPREILTVRYLFLSSAPLLL